MASILALISAVLIVLGRRSVRGVDTEIVGFVGVAMRSLPSSLFLGGRRRERPRRCCQQPRTHVI
jgi:hypothetical protein